VNKDDNVTQDLHARHARGIPAIAPGRRASP
jgi:hypothetical protein